MKSMKSRAGQSVGLGLESSESISFGSESFRLSFVGILLVARTAPIVKVVSE